MMPPSLNPEKWQLLIRDYFSVILPYLKIAFRAQNYAVINCPSTPKFFGYSGDGIPPSFNVHFLEKRINKFSAFCTHTAYVISSTLSPKSTANNSRHEIHNNLSPSFTWRIGRAGNDYFSYQNEIWTGFHIVKISHLRVTETKEIKLKYPTYRISFCPNGDTDKIRPLIELPSLAEARKLAEWYYREWLDVNSPEKGEG